VNERTIFELCKQLTGQDWAEQINHLINTTDELPLEQLMPEFGLSFELKNEQNLAFGLKFVDKAEGVLVQTVRRHGAAAEAGLAAGDIIIAIDGLKASEKLLTKYAKQNEMYCVYAFRRDELMQFEIQGSEIELSTVELKVIDQSKLDQWLKTK
ncbi:MAG: PDZ domain-containing protein, partial [Acinetobacter sp.]